MSFSHRVLSAHASEGSGTSPTLHDAEEEDFGEAQAIPGGCMWIESTEESRRRLIARRREGEYRKARERVALCGPGPSPYKEDRTPVQRQLRRLRGIRIDFPETARVILGKERAPNGNFLPVAVKTNGKNTNYLVATTTRRVSATPPATLLGGWAPQLPDVSSRLHQRPCSGAGHRYRSACLRDSASDPARGLGAATTRRVSATPPATLLGGWTL